MALGGLKGRLRARGLARAWGVELDPMAFVGQLVEILGVSSVRAFDEGTQAPSDELVQLEEEDEG